ncbi:hypothetical protein QQY24_29480 [Streptomyces sp. TG1A-8]|uniref:hypothetical protein n=1 Tax=Streptomyces sp. TG1A-8 TaxID=3051385 RepID=UPI00265B7276|nr:hypothetical protein [Streptomyces sp. TG1A-8]MDO0929338.1 hypothetical protein [Streptomyces sp. TG1A-8]
MFRTTRTSRATSAPRSSRRLTLAAAGAAAAFGLSLAVAAPATAADTADRYTADEIHTYLEDFYGEHGPDAFARKYGVSSYLKERMADNDTGYDLLVCAQNDPLSIDVGPVVTAQSAGVGWATVTTHWGSTGEDTATFTAYVMLDATRPILLQDVDCGFGG